MQNVHPHQAAPQAQYYDNTQTPAYPNHDQYLYQYQTTDPSQGYNTQPQAYASYNTGEADYYSPRQYEMIQASQPDGISAWYNFTDGSYLKGFLLGAGVTLLATNPTVQKGIVTGAVKLWSMLQGGVEEVKEQIQDVKAEMSQK